MTIFTAPKLTERLHWRLTELIEDCDTNYYGDGEHTIRMEDIALDEAHFYQWMDDFEDFHEVYGIGYLNRTGDVTGMVLDTDSISDAKRLLEMGFTPDAKPTNATPWVGKLTYTAAERYEAHAAIEEAVQSGKMSQRSGAAFKSHVSRRAKGW